MTRLGRYPATRLGGPSGPAPVGMGKVVALGGPTPEVRTYTGRVLAVVLPSIRPVSSAVGPLPVAVAPLLLVTIKMQTATMVRKSRSLACACARIGPSSRSPLPVAAPLLAGIAQGVTDTPAPLAPGRFRVAVLEPKLQNPTNPTSPPPTPEIEAPCSGLLAVGLAPILAKVS